ncbi:apoptosis-inducing factor 3 isoform X1 [Odocoileus virginianus]|uniref:Apoptosis-inducing factor 3 isoform X1 n=1 Tax=Odocoileus virginianus TaxID=9874 RepID=A0ABM4IVJ0_ODOVR
MPLPAAGPWQALGPLPCFHLLLGRTPTSDALAKSGGGGRKWGGVPGLRSPYSVGPGRAAHFCSQRAGFPWGPLACPRPRPRPSWPRRTGGGVDAGPPPGPLPWPCLPRWAASVRSTLAPGREAAAALGGGPRGSSRWDGSASTSESRGGPTPPGGILGLPRLPLSAPSRPQAPRHGRLLLQAQASGAQDRSGAAREGPGQGGAVRRRQGQSPGLPGQRRCPPLPCRRAPALPPPLPRHPGLRGGRCLPRQGPGERPDAGGGAGLGEGAGTEGQRGVPCPGPQVPSLWRAPGESVSSGDLEDFPGLDSLHKFQVKIEKEKVYVRASKQALQLQRRTKVMATCISPSAGHSGSTNVLIVGAGAAGLVCAETLRQEGFSDRIVLCTLDRYLPYDRPKLSKLPRRRWPRGPISSWRPRQSLDAQPEQLALRPKEFFRAHGIEVLTEAQVVTVDVRSKKAVFKDGFKLEYSKLLLAPGSSPRTLSCKGKDVENVLTIRTPEDANRVGWRWPPT